MFFWRRRHPISDEELSAYVDGRLQAAARARLEAHIEACAACREALAELRALRRSLRELPRAVAPCSFILREADIRRAATPQPVGALGRASPVLGGVAVAAFLAFGVLVGIDVMGQPSAEQGAGAGGQMLGYMESAEEGAARPAPATPAAAADRLPQGTEQPMESDAALPSRVPTPSISPSATPTLGAGAAEEAEEDGRTRLRSAEAAAAALALVAGGSLALVWWRRRA